MRVRVATVEDVPCLLDLLRSAPTGAQWSEAQLTKMFTGEVPGSMSFVLEVSEVKERDPEKSEGTCLVGFVTARVTSPECEIENVAVSPNRRRRGYGRVLVTAALKAAWDAGCEAVFLEVRESNNAARSLYTTCGFREVGRRPHYYSRPLEDAFLYRLDRSAEP